MNKALADHFFPQGDAIGRSFTVSNPNVKGAWQIVGIVGNSKSVSPREEPQPMAYFPAEQLTDDDQYVYWVQIGMETPCCSRGRGTRGIRGNRSGRTGAYGEDDWGSR